MNGFTALSACCQHSPGNGGAVPGLGNGPGGSGLGSANAPGGGGVPQSAGDLLQRIGAALDQAIHGGASRGSFARRANVIPFRNGFNPVPFPMVNPFKPVVKTRSPVTALNRFPDRFTYSVPAGDGEPDDEQNSFNGFGALTFDSPASQAGFAELFGSSSPSKLQTIVGGIATTLPATIQAFRASPQNIYPASGYGLYGSNVGGPYPNQAGADIGASAGAAVGNVGDTIGGIVARHPYLVLAGVGAAILLFMNPPRRR